MKRAVALPIAVLVALATLAAVAATSVGAQALPPPLAVRELLPIGGPAQPFDSFELSFSTSVEDGTLTAADITLTASRPDNPVSDY